MSHESIINETKVCFTIFITRNRLSKTIQTDNSRDHRPRISDLLVDYWLICYTMLTEYAMKTSLPLKCIPRKIAKLIQAST